ncbi:MAG: glycosyltransferase family 2 protein [Rhodothermaceae bacterium]|nr:glycosyltransferase family 2 protein [Rhodothermaceae bacterium]
MRLEDLTVIVPTKNEVRNIVAFLCSLDPEVRLIVVDASTDETRDLIARFRPDNTLVLEDPGNIPRARQLGADRAETPWLLFTDADMLFGASYFEEWRQLEVGEQVGVVQGAKLSADGEYATYYRLFSAGIGLLAVFNLPGGSGSNIIIRRQAFQDTGGFDVALSANEDSDLLWKVRRTGWRVVYQKALKVYEQDHRRLRQGMLKKTLHSWTRSLMLLTGIGADHVRRSDWGYWKSKS